MLGSINIGDINQQLLRLEQEVDHPSVAKQVLVMVHRLMFKLEFPCYFGTQSITGDLIYSELRVIWSQQMVLITMESFSVCVMTKDSTFTYKD